MAGIGFQLKKLFARKGLFATIRAYGFSFVVCAGPMVLGFALLLAIAYICRVSGTDTHTRELLNSMITYVLLASLAVSSVFSLVTTRCVADMLYVETPERIMSTFYGSLTVTLSVGVTLYAVFLYFSGVPLLYKLLSLLLFASLVVVWTEINYLTAVKDFGAIILTFAVSTIIAIGAGVVLHFILEVEIIAAMLIGVCCGYGIMAAWYLCIMYRYFPEAKGSRFYFLRWADKYPELLYVGVFTTLGLFGHIVLMWASPVRVCIQGLFYGAPIHDVAAIMAFFSIIITTVTFTTSVEVRFYPLYKDYFSLLNDNGSITDIDETEEKMFAVLREEISYLSQKQVFSTILFIVAGSLLLPSLPLGFTAEMLGIYRILCVGYGFYAIGNTLMLLLLYFSNDRGAFFASLVFAFVSNAATVIFMNGSASFYGCGFLVGSLAFFITSWILLSKYFGSLKYNILSRQPLTESRRRGLMTRVCDRLDERAQRVLSRRNPDSERKNI